MLSIQITNNSFCEIGHVSFHQALPLHILNSYAGLIFPIIISSFGIFFMRQNILTIPDPLLEAAKIDGASNFQVFRRIIVPLSKSAIAVLAIFQFMTAWSDFIWPLIITNSKRLYVLDFQRGRPF